MLENQRKNLTFLLCLTIIVSLFIGVGYVFAANGVAVSVSRVLTLFPDVGNKQIGNLQIKEDADYPDTFSAHGNSFIITLPSGLRWQNVYNEGAYNIPDYMEIKTSGLYTMTVVVYGTAKKDTYTIPMYVMFDDSVVEGYVYATIDGQDSPVPSGKYAIANVLQGSISAAAKRTFTAALVSSDYFVIRLTENMVGTFDRATDTIRLTLPKNINFDTLTVDGLGGIAGSTNLSAFLDNNRVKFTVADLKASGIIFPTENDTALGILEFRAEVNFGENARTGNVYLHIEGTDMVDDASVKVGTIVENGVTLNVDSDCCKSQ